MTEGLGGTKAADHWSSIIILLGKKALDKTQLKKIRGILCKHVIIKNDQFMINILKCMEKIINLSLIFHDRMTSLFIIYLFLDLSACA